VGLKKYIFNIDGQIFYESYSGEGPPPQQECPAGQHFDTTTNACVQTYHHHHTTRVSSRSTL